MSGKKRWAKRPFKVIKLKVYADILEKYKGILGVKGRNMQEDLESHIEEVVK